MMLYLLKITTCLVVLLLFYHCLLEGEKMHRFNRFYLLFSLIFALSIPGLTITVSPEALTGGEVTRISRLVSPTPVSTPALSASAARSSQLDFGIVVGWIYWIGVLLLSLRFARNAQDLRTKIARHETVSYRGATLVLLKESALPHAFRHYIFLDGEAYRRRQIDPCLLEHELAHVRQHHTLDILLIELLQIALWFHPLIYLYRRAVQRNHEYLADETVLKRGTAVGQYQQVLLNNVLKNNPARLTSGIGHSFTKQRFRMMTKTTSYPRILGKQVLLASTLAALAIIFVNRSWAQEPASSEKADSRPTQEALPKKISPEDSLRIIRDRYWRGRSATTGFRDENGECCVSKTYDQASEEERKKFIVPVSKLPLEREMPTPDQLTDWLNPHMYGVWLNGKRIDNSILQEYQPEDFGGVFVSRLAKNAKNYGKHYYQVELTTLPQFRIDNDRMFERLGIDQETMKLIYP